MTVFMQTENCLYELQRKALTDFHRRLHPWSDANGENKILQVNTAVQATLSDA